MILKNLISVFLLFFFLLSFSGLAIGQLISNPEVHKSYTTIRLAKPDTLTKIYPDRVLKILPPLWETQLDTIYKDSFPKGTDRITLFKEHALEWKWVERVVPNCLASKREDCLYLKMEVAPTINKRFSFFHHEDSFKIIKVQRRIRHGSLEWVEDQFPEVKFNENSSYKLIKDNNNTPVYIKVKGGNWTDWEIPICKASSSSYIKTSQIKQALKERGYYNGPIDNVMDEKVRAALLQFQKDKNIPISSNAPMPILRALGFSREEIRGF